jgi:hypothetical protein
MSSLPIIREAVSRMTIVDVHEHHIPEILNSRSVGLLRPSISSAKVMPAGRLLVPIRYPAKRARPTPCSRMPATPRGRIFREHIEGFEDAIATGFANHPERALFRGLPGAGANLAPRLLTLFGTDRSRYSSATELQRLSGVAPVTERSGSHCWVHWRWNAPWFLRQTLIEWAGQTVKFCAWAKAYHEQQKAKGQSHWAILRSLAFKWLRILWKCWKSNTSYNDELYLKQLEQRKAPIAKRARQIAQEMAA